jgi:hypothetical protein
MKKLIVFLFVILLTLPVEAQFALKGGVSFAKNELRNYVVTGQFYKELLVLSGDVLIPTQKTEDISGGGRIGIGFGGDRLRLAADVGAFYEKKIWRLGYGVEANLRLFGPIGMFGRWSMSYPVSKKENHNEVLWEHSRSEISVGIVIELINGRCY